MGFGSFVVHWGDLRGYSKANLTDDAIAKKNFIALTKRSRMPIPVCSVVGIMARVLQHASENEFFPASISEVGALLVQYSDESYKSAQFGSKRITNGSLLDQNSALSDHFEAGLERFGGQKVAQRVVIERIHAVQSRVRASELSEGAKVPRCRGTLNWYMVAPWHLGVTSCVAQSLPAQSL